MSTTSDECHRDRWRRHPQTHPLRIARSTTSGRLLGHQEFAATDRGYGQLLGWMRSHGSIRSIGVESTGSFGATLTRFLTAAGVEVVEVNRPNRLARRMDGKSDRLDSEHIARAVLGRTSTAVPKAKSGVVEVIRTLRVTRASAVKARTQAFNTLWGIMIGAPSPLRDELVVLTKRTLVNRCLRTPPRDQAICCRWQTIPNGCSSRASRRHCGTWPAAGKHSTTRSRRSTRNIAALVAPHSARAPRAPRRRRRDRRAVPRHRRRQPGTDPQRSRVREALRRRPSTRQQRPNNRPSPTQPKRRPSSKQRSLHHHDRPHAPPRTHPRPTSNDAPPKDSPNARSSAASSATSPARSTRTSPDRPTTTTPTDLATARLDKHRSIEGERLARLEIAAVEFLGS